MSELLTRKSVNRTVLAVATAGLAVLAMSGGPSAQQTSATPKKGRLNRIIERLESGGVAMSSKDWAFLDWEHGSYELDRLETTLADVAKKRTASGQIEVAPIVRIPMDGDEPFRFLVKQVLELGAFGIVFPNIETKDQAVRAIASMREAPQKYTKFPEPRGQRHCCPRKAAQYWGLPLNDYLKVADVWPLEPEGELFAMIMIESPTGVKNINEILSVPGIGAIFIGPSDLGMRMAQGPPQAEPAAETEAAIQTVLKACKEKHVVCGIPAGGALIQRRVDQGFKLLLAGGG